MDLKGEMAGRYLRIIAIVALLLGLADAAQLLGVIPSPRASAPGTQSPIALYGPAGFAYLATFAGAKLFAAVGLWLRTSWGPVLLVGATLIELAMYFTGSPKVDMSAIGFALRLLLVGSVVVLFALSLRLRRAHD